MINTELLKDISKRGGSEVFEKLGFTVFDDGSGDPRGVSWDLDMDDFSIHVDPWCEVFLRRKNPDSDPITIHCDDLVELERIIQWCKNELVEIS